ncbi:unnamed protein product [Auanema sp. JU1783]|nr:unnamed protein product [Auanema sp. JU1783]
MRRLSDGRGGGRQERIIGCYPALNIQADKTVIYYCVIQDDFNDDWVRSFSHCGGDLEVDLNSDVFTAFLSCLELLK